MIQISDTEYGATSCQRRTEPAEQPTTRNIRFPNQMIEQINIALEAGPGISQPGSLKPAVGDNVRKERAYTSIKSDEE